MIALSVGGCLSVQETFSVGPSVPTAAKPLKLGTATHFICWNVQKADHFSFKDEVGELLKTVPRNDGIMMCFQEVRSTTFEIIKGLHRENVSGHYAPSWKFPFADRSTGVLTIGNREIPESSVFSIQSPNREFFSTSPKVSLKTEIPIEDGRAIKVINCHGLNFVTATALGKQLDKIFDYLKTCDSPAIVCGDFNVWSDKRLEFLNERAQAAGLTEATPRGKEHSPAPDWLSWIGIFNGFDPNLRLDRIYTRGIEVLDCRVHDTSESSDHLPLILRYRVLPAG
ncbi:MAG: endonuclease/exonuclease/phosphatase family protein [Akkermansiaceae bacterium]